MLYEISRSQKQYIYSEKVKNLSFETHLHASYEVVYVLDGILHFIINGVKYSVKKGNAIFILPNLPHSISPSDSLSITLIFSPDWVFHFNKVIKNKYFVNPVFFPTHPEDFECILNRNEIIKKSILYGICGEILEKCETNQLNHLNHDLTQTILTYIQDNCLEDITLESTARNLGYNTCYLSNYINANFGQNFRSLVNGCRINYAMELISNTDKSITDISNLCGFSNLRSFNRAFEKHLGTCPTEYRKKI